MKRWLIRRVVIPWLRERALVLPAQKREDLSAKLKVPVGVIERIEHELRRSIINLLEEW